MRLFSNKFRSMTCLAICVAMAFPHSAMSSQAQFVIVDGVKFAKDVKEVRLSDGNVLKGAIVDQAGKPVAGMPVVVGVSGKAWAEFDTGEDGRYAIEGLKPGFYQVASYAGVETIRVYAGSAPAGALDGVVQVIDEAGITRGQCNDCNECNQCNSKSSRKCGKKRYGGLSALLSNPAAIAIVIAAAIAIPLALNNNDSAS